MIEYPGSEVCIKDLLLCLPLSFSSTEAKRLIKNNAVLVDDKIVNDILCVMKDEFLKVTIGKKKRYRVHLNKK